MLSKNMRPLIINIFGGPGSGKSTLMAGLFHVLKNRGVSVEMAPEWIKAKVYSGDPYPRKDQLYVFAQQRKRILEIGEKVDVIITDSPILLSLIYGTDNSPEFQALILAEHKAQNSLNVFVKRQKAFDPIGRYQNESEAKELDKTIKALRVHTTIANTWLYEDNQRNNPIETLADQIERMVRGGEQHSKIKSECPSENNRSVTACIDCTELQCKYSRRNR